jgi:hypothetical protein
VLSKEHAAATRVMGAVLSLSGIREDLKSCRMCSSNLYLNNHASANLPILLRQLRAEDSEKHINTLCEKMLSLLMALEVTEIYWSWKMSEV